MNLLRATSRLILPIRYAALETGTDLEAVQARLARCTLPHLPGLQEKGRGPCEVADAVWTPLESAKRRYQNRFLMPYISEMLGAGGGSGEAAVCSLQVHRAVLARLTRGGGVFRWIKVREGEAGQPLSTGEVLQHDLLLQEIELHAFNSGLAFLVLELVHGVGTGLAQVQEALCKIKSLERDDQDPPWLVLAQETAPPSNMKPERFLCGDGLVDRVVQGEPFSLQELVQRFLTGLCEADPCLAELRSAAWGLRFYGQHLLVVGGGQEHQAAFLDRREDTRDILRLTRHGHAGYAVRDSDLDPLQNPDLHFVAGNVLLSAGREASVLVLRINASAESGGPGSRAPTQGGPPGRDFDLEQPRRLLDGYFNPLLLVLHQSIGLVELQHRAAGVYREVFHGGSRDAADIVAPVRRLLERVLAFTLCHCFSEVGRITLYRLVYATWFRVFNIQRTWDDLRAEVRELDDFLDRTQQISMLRQQTEILEKQRAQHELESRAAAREMERIAADRVLQQGLALLGAILLPLSVVFSWFGMNYQVMDRSSSFLPDSPLDLMLLVSTGGALVLFIAIVLLLLAVSRRAGRRARIQGEVHGHEAGRDEA